MSSIVRKNMTRKENFVKIGPVEAYAKNIGQLCSYFVGKLAYVLDHLNKKNDLDLFRMIYFAFF